MKILSVIVLSGAALALAGCGNQGGSSDDYNTGSGAASSTNYYRSSTTTNYQGDAFSRDRLNTGDNYRTNYPGLGTNDQDGATSPRNYDSGGEPVDSERTNNAPEI